MSYSVGRWARLGVVLAVLVGPAAALAQGASLVLTVRSGDGQLVPNARVSLGAAKPRLTDATGRVRFDSLTAGTQEFRILAIGFWPSRHTVTMPARSTLIDTVIVVRRAQSLDAMVVMDSNDPVGFKRRQAGGYGEFLTAADIAALDPPRTTALLRGRGSIRAMFDRSGNAVMTMTAFGSGCRPTILLDGFPAPPIPPAKGRFSLDYLIEPDEIGGIEIYTNQARTPPELLRFVPPGCGVVAVWTKEAIHR